MMSNFDYEEVIYEINILVKDRFVKAVAIRMVDYMDFAIKDKNLIAVETNLMYDYIYYHVGEGTKDGGVFNYWLNMPRVQSSLMGHEREYFYFEEQIDAYLMEVRRKERINNMMVSMTGGSPYVKLPTILTDAYMEQKCA